MAALTSEQKPRAKEAQSDIACLVDADYDNINFTQWWNDYNKYVTYGPADSVNGGQRPPHRPPI